MLLCMLCVLNSVVSNSLELHGLQATRLLCPWNFPGKNTGVGCHLFLQGMFLTQGLNLCFLQWQADSLPLSHLGSPVYMLVGVKFMQSFQSAVRMFQIYHYNVPIYSINNSTSSFLLRKYLEKYAKMNRKDVRCVIYSR